MERSLDRRKIPNHECRPPERSIFIMTKAMFRSFKPLLVLVLALSVAVGSAEAKAPKKMLVVTVTKGFRHSSIATAEKVLGQLAEKDGSFAVDYVRNDQEMAEKMTVANLKKYDGVIFANTTGDLPLPD